ncbi:hypothetical protein [Acinetobacter pittii]|uniref:hypothetical protein n=1 Tax=Acinetobacter pittii TaxID=48296 RepID=UPI002952F637|nr:hypothetical protein [Acinetobacter pittii]MDV7706703.1 hypothetical protein [Acinetobacter pittii]MDV7759751.1 hypothetical protein [Acinetobacter pittii]
MVAIVKQKIKGQYYLAVEDGRYFIILSRDLPMRGDALKLYEDINKASFYTDEELGIEPSMEIVGAYHSEAEALANI